MANLAAVSAPRAPRLAPADLDAYRRDRARKLERENEYLRHELERTRLLLNLACRCAAHDLGWTWEFMLDLLCEIAGTDPAKPAFVEAEERRARDADLDRFLVALK